MYTMLDLMLKGLLHKEKKKKKIRALLLFSRQTCDAGIVKIQASS